MGKDMMLVIPFALAVAFAAFAAMDKLMLAIIFLTPLSVKLSELSPGYSFDLDLPTEPLLLGMTAVFILKYLNERYFDPKFLKHPISIALFFYLLWQFFTSITSSMPLVSFKASISKLWFIIPFYFIAGQMFREKSNISKYFTVYAISLLIVSIYTMARHATHHFAHGPAHYVMSPFFIDHTSYGAALAFILPLLYGVNNVFSKSANRKFFYWLLLGVLSMATVLSYTRAAWLGLIGAAGVWILMFFRIRVKYILIPLAIVLGLLFINREQIIIAMSQNNTESSSSFSEHVSSMTNISSDASNLERLNRWSCAVRMFYERPVVGWGPGTYMFQYAPFQLASERTVISTNASDLGNAHSEYLGPLAESGLLGTISVLAIIITTIIAAIRSYYNAPEKWMRQMVLFALLGLVTYYLHAFLNNFLDTDKITSVFWASTALIVVIDIQTNKASL